MFVMMILQESTTLSVLVAYQVSIFRPAIYFGSATDWRCGLDPDPIVFSNSMVVGMMGLSLGWTVGNAS